MGLLDVFGDNKKDVTLIIIGAAASALAPAISDKELRNLVSVGGIGLGLWGTLRLIYKQGGQFGNAVNDAAALPAGKGSWFERALGTFGRAIGQEPQPGISTSPDRPATEDFQLGKPKNILGITGKIRSPSQDQEIKVALFSDTIPIDAAVMNQGSAVQSGKVIARALINGFPKEVIGPEMTLQPGEFRNVAMRIPTEYSVRDIGPRLGGAGIIGHRYDLAIRWNAFTLDRITFLTD